MMNEEGEQKGFMVHAVNKMQLTVFSLKITLPLWLIHKSKPSSGRLASSQLLMKTEWGRERPLKGGALQVKGLE